MFATARNGHTYLYVPIASYAGDWGEYQGHIVTIDLEDGSQKVFNMICSDQTVHFTYAPGPLDCPDIQASVWGRATLVYQPALDKIFMTTANGSYDPGKHDWGASIIALHPDGSGANGDPLDSYTPGTYAFLNNFDIDLGSTAPVILPVPPNSAVQNLALQGGKDGKLRLLNLTVAKGNKVAQKLAASGTMKGNFWGRQATGRRATWKESHINRFANGKLVEHWAFINQMSLFEQLGLSPDL